MHRLTREVFFVVLGGILCAVGLLQSPTTVDAGGQAVSKYTKSWEYKVDLSSNRIGPSFTASPVIADVTGDGIKEVVTHDSNFVDVIADTNKDGKGETIFSKYVPNPPQSFSCDFWGKEGCELATSLPIPPVVADMDGDGRKDIVAYNTLTYNFEIFNPQKILPSLHVGGDLVGFTVADIDHDGTPPEIVGSLAYGPNYRIFVHNGKQFWSADYFVAGTALPSSPVVGDLNRDGRNEIIYSINSNVIVLSKTQGSIWSWQSPTSMSNPKIWSNIAIGDINRDGQNDLIVSTFDHVYALTVRNNALVELWRRAVPRNPNVSVLSVPYSIALGDMDKDPSSLEILLKTTNVLVVLDGGDGDILWNGTNLVGKMNPDSDPALADIDADGKLDVLVGANAGLMILEPFAQGTVTSSFDISISNTIVSPAGDVAVDDLDGNGTLEFVWTQVYTSIPQVIVLGQPLPVLSSAGPGILRVFSANESNAPAFPAWPRVHGNNRHSSMYGDFDHASFIRGDANRDKKVDISDTISLQNYVNGSGRLSCLKAADVNDDGAVNVHDTARLVGFLFAGTQPAPVAPYPGWGIDSTLDTLSCE